MQWNSLEEFLAMGGYARYVWSSFGITALVIAGEIWQARRKRHAVLAGLRDQLAEHAQTDGGGA